MFNVGEWLLDRNVHGGDGDRVAISCGDDHVTYGELLDRVRATAAGLRSAGIRPEERVAMVMLDSVEFTVTFLAALRVGSIPMPVNPLLPPRDVVAILTAAGARLAVVSQERAATAEGLKVAGCGQVIVTGTPDWKDLANGDG